MRDNLGIIFSEEGANTPEVHPVDSDPKFDKTPGTVLPSILVDDEENGDNHPLSWAVKRRMVLISSKGKEKVPEEKFVNPKPYSTRSSIRKFMSDAMKENKARTNESSRRRKTMVDEDQIPYNNVIEVSREKSESEIESGDIVSIVEKRRNKALQKKKPSQKPTERKVSTQKKAGTKKKGKGESVKRRVKKTTKRKGEESLSIDELFGESGSESEKEPCSNGKTVKVEKELTKEERVQILKTQKVLNGKLFDSEILS